MTDAERELRGWAARFPGGGGFPTAEARDLLLRAADALAAESQRADAAEQEARRSYELDRRHCEQWERKCAKLFAERDALAAALARAQDMLRRERDACVAQAVKELPFAVPVLTRILERLEADPAGQAALAELRALRERAAAAEKEKWDAMQDHAHICGEAEDMLAELRALRDVAGALRQIATQQAGTWTQMQETARAALTRLAEARKETP